MKKEKSVSIHYSALSDTVPIPQLGVDEQFLAYFIGDKSEFLKDIQDIKSGNIDEYNLDCLDQRIDTLRMIAQAKLKKQYEHNRAILVEIQNQKAVEIQRINAMIDLLESKVKVKEENEESEYRTV